MLNNSYDMKADLPVMVKILDVIDETVGYKTFLFEYSANVCEPGQFLMIWLPRVNEKPFTISYNRDGILGITVQLKGHFTEELFKLNKGDYFGVRGAYGNGYKFDMRKKACVITGGSGTATILPLIDALETSWIIIGARSKEQLLYVNKFEDAIYATDDGSYGYNGTVVQAFSELIEREKIDIVYTCGPEKMMNSIIQICKENRIECQFALERYMKCGIGICGNCTCGKKRVCVEGPVFQIEDLPALNEFNKTYRTKLGKSEDY